MNEITSTPHDSSSGGDFAYRIDGRVISIEQLKWNERPVDEVLEQAIRKIEYYHQGSVASFKIQYRDAKGLWGAAKWDGGHAEVVPIVPAE